MGILEKLIVGRFPSALRFSAVVAVVTGAALVAAAPGPARGGEPLQRPRLIVGITVDQMRWDYLYRFHDRYGEGGFRRLLKDGFACENTCINYVPTVTACGHASIYTGSVPAIHGIAGNDFLIQKTGERINCVGDKTVNGVGSDLEEGKKSPHNLLSTTITDELRLATNFRSKVVGIAIKDRGGILPAGRAANAAYWFESKTGNWITSSYYMPALPDWVERFNQKQSIAAWLKTEWKPLHPLESYLQSTADKNGFERPFGIRQTVFTFPISMAALSESVSGAVRYTPYGNTMTFDFAKAAIEGEQLGADADPDFLTVSLSSTDYAGHAFGPNSPRMEDMYLRLDRDLESFFARLDETVGQGNYLVFLTADHGATHNAGFLKEHKLPTGLWDPALEVRLLNHALAGKYKAPQIVRRIDNYRVCLDYEALAANGIDEAAVRADCVKFLLQREGVAYAVDIDAVERAPIPAILRERIVNGYNRERSGVIQIILKPGWYSGNGFGVTHSAWNPSDSHIPLLWMGWGIRPGSTNRATAITDIAPTLAALLKISAPSGSIGSVIPEVTREVRE